MLWTCTINRDLLLCPNLFKVYFRKVAVPDRSVKPNFLNGAITRGQCKDATDRVLNQ